MELDFDKMNGLVPAIIQDNETRKVLMLGFMNKEALTDRWQSFNEGKPGVRWLDIWLCVVLEHWLEKNNIEY